MESVTTDMPDASCASRIMGLQTKDLVSALSAATLASETTQHTLQKKTNVLSEKGRNTSLVYMYYVGGTSSISRCMLSGVITVTDCLLFYRSLNEILLRWEGCWWRIMSRGSDSCYNTWFQFKYPRCNTNSCMELFHLFYVSTDVITISFSCQI